MHSVFEPHFGWRHRHQPSVRTAGNQLRRLAANRPEIAAQVTAGLVGIAMGVPQSEILSPLRGNPKTAFARQVAMYLLHTALSLPYAAVARICRRDRTTVSHACRLVEDMRDDRGHDQLIAKIEEMLLAVDPLIGEGEPA